jgi:hypothetical protein
MSRVELFCPKCAEPMLRVGAELTCVTGGMGLSRHLEAALLARFGDHVDQVAAKSGDASAPWFCPACRMALNAEATCPKCLGSLRDLLFQLLELHPHQNL